MRLSEHLQWEELGCRDGTPYPQKWVDRAHALARVFETLRKALGSVPLHVLSAYRTPEWNTKVGGAKFSQHLQGRAIDVRTPSGWTPVRMAIVVKNLIKEGSKITGLGIYPWGIHIDIRPTNKLVAWSATVQKEA